MTVFLVKPYKLNKIHQLLEITNAYSRLFTISANVLCIIIMPIVLRISYNVIRYLEFVLDFESLHVHVFATYNE